MKSPNRILQNFSNRPERFLKRLPTDLLLEGALMHLTVTINGRKLQVAASRFVKQHSDAFIWGYDVPSALQLSLAILLRYWPPELAQEYYLDFHQAFILILPKTDFIKTVNLQERLRQIVHFRHVNFN